MSRTFYIAVTQQVLLFGAETWVLTKKMESTLDAFQGRVARTLTGRQTCCGKDGRWFYPSLAGAMKKAGIVYIHTSILRRQNTVAQFILTPPILDLCKGGSKTAGCTGPKAVVGADGDRLEGGQRKGGSKGRSGRAGVDGLGLGARVRHTGWDSERHRGGGVPGSKRLQWSGVDRGGGLTPSGGDLKQVQCSGF